MAGQDIAAESLGDILGRALRGDFDPLPAGRTDAAATDGGAYLWPTLDAAGAVIDQQEISGLEWWRLMSSWRAAKSIAEHYDLSFEDVRHVLQRIPENLMPMLDSPQGWTVLGEQIAIAVDGTLPGSPMLLAIH